MFWNRYQSASTKGRSGEVANRLLICFVFFFLFCKSVIFSWSWARQIYLPKCISVMCSYPHATKLILTIVFVLFSESHHTLDLYKHMVAFVMAYSFTENSTDEDDDSDSETAALTGPAMVPMADILNHISNNNAHLEFGDEKLTMVAVQDISKVFSFGNTVFGNIVVKGMFSLYFDSVQYHQGEVQNSQTPLS